MPRIGSHLVRSTAALLPVAILFNFWLGLARAQPAATPRQQAATSPTATPEGIEFFEKRIRPLLADNCLSCHGDKKKGGLQLDSPSAMLQGGDSGTAIRPGNPAESLLIKAVQYADEPKMPPDGKLPTKRSRRSTAWVKMGAPGRRKPSVRWRIQPPTPGNRTGLFNRSRTRRCRRSTDADWRRSPIDNFIVGRPAAARPCAIAAGRSTHAHAAPALTSPVCRHRPKRSIASSTILIRPPSTGVVERLLASPHYGERWARHWLDVARYADTKGYVFTEDRNYPNAFRYRDWVVRALERRLAVRQFLIEQIAADRLRGSGDNGALAAMGFLDGRPPLLEQSARHHRRSARRADARHDGADRHLRSLPRSQVRSDSHGRLLFAVRRVGQLRSNRANRPSLMTLADAPQPVEPHVFVRGQSGQSGPGGPAAVSCLCWPAKTVSPFASGSGRLELARAIASRDNPLTARVIVNRVWGYYFDEPLVRTPSDFGMRSEPPSHPELLDFLATWLVDRRLVAQGAAPADSAVGHVSAVERRAA